MTCPTPIVYRKARRIANWVGSDADGSQENPRWAAHCERIGTFALWKVQAMNDRDLMNERLYSEPTIEDYDVLPDVVGDVPNVWQAMPDEGDAAWHGPAQAYAVA